MPMVKTFFGNAMRYVDVAILCSMMVFLLLIGSSLACYQWVHLLPPSGANPLVLFGPEINNMFYLMGIARNATTVENDLVAYPNEINPDEYIELNKLSIGINSVCYCKRTMETENVHWRDGVEFYSLMENGEMLAFSYETTRFFAVWTWICMIMSFLIYSIFPGVFYKTSSLYVLIVFICTMAIFTETSFGALFPHEGTDFGHGYYLFFTGVFLSIFAHFLILLCFRRKDNK